MAYGACQNCGCAHHECECLVLTNVDTSITPRGWFLDDVREEIASLGYPAEEAKEILQKFLVDGGLSCLSRWPDEFSFCTPRRNVFDILLAAGLV